MAAANDPDVILEKLTRARISLLLRQPFWGTLATRLILKDYTDRDWCTTAATDGRYFYYNRDFIAKLNKEETIFLVAHEVEHCVYDHMGRRGSRNAKAWNAAADYVINWELHEHNVGKIPNPKTSGVTACFDSKFRGMFTEEVYEQLMKDPNQQFPEFDIHLEPGDGKGEPMSEEERRQLGDEIRAAVYSAVKSNTGHCPAGVKRLVQDLTAPQMDWREILQMNLKSILKGDFTWSRCSRKSQSSGIYLPSMKEEGRVSAAIALDSSGSMTDEMLRDFLSEVKGIMQEFHDFELRVWCSDTKVYNEQIYTPDNLDEIDSYEILGRGGNDFNCNWDYMKEKGIVPEKFIHFTDGYDCGLGFGDPLYCDTVYVIHSNPQRNIVSPFGMTCYYDKD